MDPWQRRLAPVMRRLRGLVTRATVGLVDDGAQMQALQVRATADETLDACEHWQGYGLTVHPHPGAEALLLAGGGKRAMPLIVACADRRYRLTGLAEGEVALHDDQGQAITLTRTGIVITGNVQVIGTLTVTQLVAAQNGLTLGGGSGVTAAITGDLNVIGSITSSGDQVADGISQISHVHSGVAPGGANTGVPV